jgi:hypothetical protein
VSEQPNTPAALQQAYVSRLAAKVTRVAAEPFGPAYREYVLAHPVGALLVTYVRAEYATPADAGDVVQARTLVFDVVAVVRDAAGGASHGAALEVLEEARRALAGLRVPGFRSTQVKRERFLEHAAGEWKYALTVAAATVAVEDDESIAGPPLERVTFTTG